MAANLFGRYVWLIDVLRQYKRLTYEEINRLWKRSGLNDGEREDLPLRTFHNHCKAIEDIFDVNISCDKRDGYRYYIETPELLEGDGLRSWLVDSYSVLNQIQADKKLEGRILFEDIPSGHEWLTLIAQAMREGRVLRVVHQGFGKPEENYFDIEPYCLRVIQRRWYVLARSPYYSDLNRKRNVQDGGTRPADVYLLYALDRLHHVAMTDKTFDMNQDFDAETYFNGYYGVIADKRVDIERIVVKVYGIQRWYVDSLPLHESQRKIAEDDESMTFEFRVRPTFDFYQALLAQTDAAVVLEPEDVRKTMKRFAENLLDNYKDA